MRAERQKIPSASEIDIRKAKMREARFRERQAELLESMESIPGDQIDIFLMKTLYPRSDERFCLSQLVTQNLFILSIARLGCNCVL